MENNSSSFHFFIIYSRYIWWKNSLFIVDTYGGKIKIFVYPHNQTKPKAFDI